MQSLLLRSGFLASILILTIASIIFSNAVCFLIVLAKGETEFYFKYYFLMATLVPAFASPPITACVIHLIFQLDRARRELEIASTKDAMTGISNRGHFFQLAAGELSKARRSRSPLTLMIFDIDHFKRINDQHGHAAGDMAICTIAQVSHGVLGSDCIFARLGGEEFVCLLPQTPMDDAMMVADRLRGKIANLGMMFDGRRFSLSVSVGVAELAPGDRIEDLVRRADERMYLAKRNGRNQLVGGGQIQHFMGA